MRGSTETEEILRAGADGGPRHATRNRRVIVVAPQFPPSNLASVHRSRLLSRHLAEFGWEPIIVTVHHEFYEEALDWNLAKLVPDGLRVESVGALRTRPIRLVGDIGIRGFVPMLRRILDILDTEGADFLYVTIPSFFAAPLGRLVHRLRGTPYGIDYIDPWVHELPRTVRPLSKYWISSKLARILEPVAVRNASLISGVTEGSFSGVLERNPHLKPQVVTVAMPYGGDPADHKKVRELRIPPYLFKQTNRFRVLYAGTMWDAARAPLDRVFRAIASNRERFSDVEFHFIGTGASPNNPVPQITPIAEQHGIPGDLVIEHPNRIPYLDVLAHLEAADAVFIFGSALPHYTPSKLYQGVLAGKPIMAVLHEESTACTVLRDTGAGHVLAFRGDDDLQQIEDRFACAFADFRHFAAQYDPRQVDRTAFEPFSARSVARSLAHALDRATVSLR